MWFAAGFNWMAVDVSGCGLIGVGLSTGCAHCCCNEKDSGWKEVEIHDYE